MMADPTSEDGLLGALAQEFLDRHRRGEGPSVAEYAEQHPELNDEIREFFPTLAMMEALKPGSADPTGTFGGAGLADGGRIPERLGDFRILREAGRGGMGVVYEAHQESLGRRVALKVLAAHALGDPQQVRRFLREARSAARLHHTNIVPVFGVGEQDGVPYYVMQFIHGRGFDEILDELRTLRGGTGCELTGIKTARTQEVPDSARSLISGKYAVVDPAGGPPDENGVRTEPDSTSPPTGTAPPSRITSPSESTRLYARSVARIGLQVADALGYAHEQGMHHRDIKPSNLLLDAHGTAWVADFGLAKATEHDDLTHTGDIVGTTRYMAPERFQGRCDARSDLYGLGLTLYEFLALRPAFDESDRNRLIHQVTQAEPPRLSKLCPDVPDDLATVIHKAIERDPEDRYASAAALGEDLQRFLDDRPILARSTGPVENLRRWCRRKPMTAALFGTVLFLLVAVASVSTGLAFQVAAAGEQSRRQAIASRGEAERANAVALQEADARRVAEEARAQARRYLYVAHMNLAQQAWEQSNVGRLRALLGRQRHEPGQEDLRGFEWYYWSKLSHGYRTSLDVSDRQVKVVTYSPDGKTLATGSTDKMIRLWDVATGLLKAELPGHEDFVWSVQFSPDGRTLASGGWDRSVKLWDVATAKPIASLQGHKGNVWSVRFSTDGKSLASASGDRTIIMWDLATRTMRRSLTREGGSPHDLAYSPDGTLLASGNEDATVTVWNVETGALGTTLKGHTGRIFTAAFSPDGMTLASAGEDREIRLWDVATGQEKATLRGHTNWVTSVAFSPDGRTLATGSADNTVRLWDVATAEPKATLKGHASAVGSVTFSPDGGTLASASDDRTVKLWATRPAVPNDVLAGHTDEVTSVALSPDGKVAATGSRDRTVRLWNVATGASMATLEGQAAAVLSVSFSKDGDTLASAGEDGSTILWEMGNRRARGTLKGHAGAVRAASFSPDGKSLATGGMDGTVRLWDVPTAQAGAILRGPGKHVYALAYSPDGKSIATGGEDNTVRLWDVATGTPKMLSQGSGYGILCLAFSPDGKSLAWGGIDRTVVLRDLATGRSGPPLEGHSNWVSSVTFSPDGKTLASAGFDQSVMLWDVASAEVKTTLAGHAKRATAVAFSADGRVLASAGGDNTVRLWRAASEAEVRNGDR